MPNKVLINIFLICFVLLGSCKKYPEQKGISLKKPWKRLAGMWSLNDYKFNGITIVPDLNSKFKLIDIRNIKLDIGRKQGDNAQHLSFLPYENLKINGFDNPLVDNDERFRFTYETSGTALGDSVLRMAFLTPLRYSNPTPNYTKWSIKNLYKNNLHLELQTDTGNYEIFFKKK